MSRYINLADTKGRNAEIVFSSKSKKPLVKLITTTGGEVHTLRVLKGAAENAFEGLTKSFGDAEAVAQAIIKDDPDINLELIGRFIKGTTRVYVDANLKPATRVNKKEIVHAPDGSIKEERDVKETVANILAENPVKGGKLFPRKDFYNKLVFAKKYQLSHVNGLTFDFLYEIAKDLHEKDSLMMLGAGAKGNEPLVFQDGGKTYRAFLEGRVKDGKYLLLLHLSNLELKGIA